MPADFDPSFQNPHWAWWIVVYFFLGGVTGGVAFAAAWLDLFGEPADRPAVRLGRLIALPLILLSSVFLIVDLGQPLRFWHMLFESERFPTPIMKPYSPMSLGSGILFVFGTVAFLLFAAELIGRGRWLVGNALGKLLSVLGALSGLALAGYTGALLNVSNEPVWNNSPFISALFLFSGVSTGTALLLLAARPRASRATLEKLSEADTYLMLLELVTLLVFLVTLGALGTRFILGQPTAILFGVVILLGLLVPLALHWQPRLVGGARMASTLSAILVLLGGFVLRWAVLAAPQGIGL